MICVVMLCSDCFKTWDKLVALMSIIGMSNIFKNLNIIPSRTSQNLSLKYHLLFANYFAHALNKKIIAITIDYRAIKLKTLHRKYLITLRKYTN